MLGDKKNREEMHTLIKNLQLESNLALIIFIVLSLLITMSHQILITRINGDVTTQHWAIVMLGIVSVLFYIFQIALAVRMTLMVRKSGMKSTPLEIVVQSLIWFICLSFIF